MKHQVAKRMAGIEPFHVMKILARARQLEAAGKDIVHMEIGEPDFPSPPAVIQAGITALESGYTHYTPALGYMPLREAIAQYYKDNYAVEISPDRVIITPGSSGALQLLFGTLLDAGDQVLMTDPGYPCNRHFVRLFDGEAVSIPVSAENNFQPSVAEVKTYLSKATRALMVASPANPTGTVLSQSQLKALAEVLLPQNAYLIVDEIYHGLEYQAEKLGTALDIAENVFIVNSFSKFFGMTGWRLGWMIAPEQFVPAIDKLAQNIFLAASTPAQHAALACFTDETRAEVENRRKAFEARRDYLIPELQSLGFNIETQPQGAFYVYADCSRFTDDSQNWCKKILEEVGVAITPGIDFGSHLSKTHVRFAYTTSIERLREGVSRLKTFLNTY